MEPKSKETKDVPEKLSMKCPKCNREFYDYSEYRVEMRLKQHLRDKHSKRTAPLRR